MSIIRFVLTGRELLCTLSLCLCGLNLFFLSSCVRKIPALLWAVYIREYVFSEVFYRLTVSCSREFIHEVDCGLYLF